MELIIGNRYEVKVTAIVKSGAVMELEDGTTTLIHVSNIAEEFVRDASDYVAVGDTLVAIAQEGVVRPVELSLKNLKLPNKKKEAAERPRSKSVYGGSVNPSRGFGDSRQYTSNSSSSNHKPRRDEELDKMIKKSNEDLKSKTYFNDKKARKRKGSSGNGRRR